MEDTQTRPAGVSAVVLNYNGGQMVLDCLASLKAQDPPCAEIICVDNESRDGSVGEVESKFPDVRLIRLSHNVGFAGGMNRGITHSSSEFVALINLDVALEPDYLQWCTDALRKDERLGGVTGKLLRPEDTHPPLLDTTGHTVYRNRRAVDRGEREPDLGQYDSRTALFSLCGAAPVFRRDTLNDIRLGGEYFDEDFFAYFEDFDLCWRAQLRGWRFAYVPQAVGRHYRGGSDGKASTFILSCNHRNRLLVMLHNDTPASFLRHLPGIAYTELRASLHMLGLRPAALLKAWVDLLKLLPGQLVKRRRVQHGRTVDWKELEIWFEPYDYRFSEMVRRARQRATAR
ncbi:glycosyltransferase family 2 protein [soil metagenome]